MPERASASAAPRADSADAHHYNMSFRGTPQRPGAVQALDTAEAAAGIRDRGHKVIRMNVRRIAHRVRASVLTCCKEYGD